MSIESVPAVERVDTPEAGAAAIRGGALRIGVHVVGVVLGLVSVPLLYRHLGNVDFGRYVLATSIVVLVAGVTDAGLFSVAQREQAMREGEERRATLASILGLRLTLSVLSVTLGVAIAAALGYDGILVLGVLIAGLGFAVQVVQTLLTVPVLGELRFGWVTLIELLRQALGVVGLVALVLVGTELLPFFLVLPAAALVSLAVTLPLVRRAMPLRPTFDRARWASLLRATIPYAAAAAIYAIYFRATVVLLSLVSDEQQTGYFATAFRITEVVLAAPGLLVGAVFPILSRAARDDRERLRAGVQRLLEVSIAGGVGLALLICVGAPIAIAVVAGAEGEPAVPVLRLQGFAVASTFLAVAASFTLLSLHRHRALLLANALAIATVVPATLALAAPFGAQGAAVATIVGEIALAGSALLLLLREPGLDLSLRFVPRVVLAAGLATGVAVLLPVPVLVQTLALGAVYLGALRVLGLVPPEILAAVRRR